MVTPEVAGMCKRNLPRLYNRVIPAAWSDAAFDKFLRSVVVPAAQSEGIPQRTLRSTMLRVERQQRDEDATARAAAPPERAQGPNSAAAYVSALACDKRTSSGVKRLAELAAPLEDIEARTGVPREVLVAIWGVESAYGGFTGQHYTCRALATLAYEAEREEDHVRAHFFTTELVAAMRLEVQGIVRNAAEDLMGSYSGAIGQPQFMPSNYFRFAQRYKDVEPNGNEMGSVEGIGAPVVVDDVQRNGPLLESARYQGWPDIWGNEEDTLMSIANFLVEHGWPTHSSSWRASAAVLGDAAARQCEPPWEAVRSSAAFKSVRRYNPSDRYAAAVLTLAHRISVGSER